MQDKDRPLAEIFLRLRIQPVGRGYTDCICPKENIDDFISEMDGLGIEIEGFTWWCLSENGHEPCGMGGPRNEYGDGFYSEIGDSGVIKFHNNEGYKQYLLHEFPRSSNYKKCLVPAFWLQSRRGNQDAGTE